jgi:glycerol kinase
VWAGPDDVAAHWREERRFVPAADADSVAHRRDRWRAAVERAKDWSERT